MTFYSHADAANRLRDYLAVRRACGDRRACRNIAERAGVAPQAVSQMLNGKARVNNAVAAVIGLREVHCFVDRECDVEELIQSLPISQPGVPSCSRT